MRHTGFRSQRAADAAARAGVELDKIEPVKLFVLYLFEHFYDIFYSVRGKIFIFEQGRRLAAARRPVDSHEPRLAGVLGRAEVVHLLQEHGIYILHRYHGVDIRLRQADGLLDGGYLRGARRDKNIPISEESSPVLPAPRCALSEPQSPWEN